MSDAPWRDAGVLEEMYASGMSQREIADDLGCTQPCVQKWMKRLGVDARPTTHEKNPSVTTNRHGYERTQHKDGRGNHTVMHHRLLAVSEYGFDAIAGKEIHHKNGIPWDNRPSNIEPVEPREHRLIHAPEAGARIGTKLTPNGGGGGHHFSNGRERVTDNNGEGRPTVPIHRLLAVSEYGFESVVGREVHHRNGIPWDNRRENISIGTAGDRLKRTFGSRGWHSEVVEP